MARKPKPVKTPAAVLGSAAPPTARSEAGVQIYPVVAPFKLSGVRYAPGETIALTADEYDDLPPGLVGRPEEPGSEPPDPQA